MNEEKEKVHESGLPKPAPAQHPHHYIPKVNEEIGEKTSKDSDLETRNDE